MVDVNWKDRAEVEEYLDNIGTEYQFSCLHEQNPEGCHLLGDYLETFKDDFKTSAAVYSTNCERNNHPRSCYRAGSNSLVGRGVEPDKKKAIEHFRRGCQEKSKESCLMSGVLLSSQPASEETKKDIIEGLENLNKGCSLKSVKCCAFASQLYRKGLDGVIEKDLVKAFELARKGCQLGNKYACSNVSQMYKKGQGVEKNQELYMQYKDLAREIDRQSKGGGIEFQQYV